MIIIIILGEALEKQWILSHSDPIMNTKKSNPAQMKKGQKWLNVDKYQKRKYSSKVQKNGLQHKNEALALR